MDLPAVFGDVEETSVPEMLAAILSEDQASMLSDLNNDKVLNKISSYIEEHEQHGAREANHRQTTKTFRSEPKRCKKSAKKRLQQ